MKHREINIIRKKGRPRDVRVAIAYPSIYEVATSSLAHQMLYFYINSEDNFLGERYVLEKLDQTGDDILSIESGTPLKNNEIIIFSVHYEPDYANIVKMLRDSGIELLSSKRTEHIVVVGGPPVIANPEPLSEIADILVIGEIEPIFPKLLKIYLEYRDDKKNFLDSLSPKEGFYVPSQEPKEINFVYSPSLPLEFHPIAQIQSLDSKHTWMRSTMIEAMRGCFRRCKFCLEGTIFQPKRDRPLSQIKEIAVKGREYNRTNSIVLYSLSFFDHEEADKILDFLVDEKFVFSVPSMRVETLNEDRLEVIAKGGQKTLTIAPETASHKLGLLIGKPFVDDMIENIAVLAKKKGFKSLKMYFMIGLPSEETEDINAIISFVKKLAEKSGFKSEKQLKITVNPFIPKPHTPFELYPLDDIKDLKKKILLMKRSLCGIAEIREYDPRWARVQTTLNRGGKELTKTIILWAEYGGGLGSWRKALKESGVKEEKYLGNMNEKVPWHIVKLH